MSVPQLELLELVEELLDAHRWLQVLGFANQFVLQEKLGLTQAERDRVLEAATRAVDKDARLVGWRERLARIRAELAAGDDGSTSAAAPRAAGTAPSG